MTNTENINHGTRNSRVANMLKKAVVMMDLEDNIIREFSYIGEAVKCGHTHSQVSKCCNGLNNKHHGYTWKFKS